MLQRTKSPPKNPYLDLWAWSCKNLEWAGPVPETRDVRQSHHVLPVFYHHFGCICPTYEALSLIRQLAHRRPPADGGSERKPDTQRRPRPIFDVGSGNGYWTYMLRRLGLDVRAIDSGVSAWRTVWIPDTIAADGVTYLREQGSGGGSDGVLLLVYPQVGGDFTGRCLRAYAGDSVVVAGTQNGNGFTGFGDETVDVWVARELDGWEKIVQIPLPSFAGKDEALYVFVRS